MLQTSDDSALLVVAPATPMTLPHAIALLRDMEDKLQTPGVRNLVLDLAAVKEVDGSGLGAVVKLATEARASGLGLYLYRPSQEVLDALHELEIHGFFPILDYEEDVLAHTPD